MKTCRICGQGKNLDEFFIRKDGGKKRHRNDCKTCCADRMMIKNYGIDLSTYDRMYLEQGGVCKICSLPQKSTRNERLCIDHDHETGKVRGLLCDGCNRGIGLLKDDYRIIERAASYLRCQTEE